MWTFHLTFGFISIYADIRLRLFLENLIRENRRKWSKSLPALKVFLLKNGVNTSKDQGHFMRIFGHAYFWKTSYEKIAWSGQNPYRRWRCFHWKTASTLPALKVFSLKNCFNTGKDWVTFSEKARMRLSKNRPILRLYGLRIKILKNFFTGSENSLRSCRNSKKIFFWQFFRGWKNGSKLHFSHFEWRFFINFASMLREFWVSGARWGRILPESEERIEKFVDFLRRSRRHCIRNM